MAGLFVARSGEGGSQVLQLPLAPHEPAAMNAGPPPRRPPGRQATRAHLRRPPFHGKRLQGLDAHGAPDQTADVVAKQDLARRRDPLEPGRDIEGIAGRERRAPRARAEEHLTRLDAELHGDLDSAVALQLRAQRGARVTQLDGGADRTQRVVLVQLGHAEDPYDRVADEPLHRAPMPLDHRAAHLHIAVQQPVHRFRIEPLGQPRRTHEVGEDDAHQPARGASALGLERRHVGLAARRRGPAAGSGGSSTAANAGAASAGSCASIAPSRSRSRSPGSMPSSSTSFLRAS